jgi:hypothetical protein
VQRVRHRHVAERRLNRLTPERLKALFL